ncbi:MAG: hypothetical protein PHF67_02360 [Candidatus Nanoarchaeia archaeon]|nr:hypothetical protein [Candidatus Nanoarchaeia archaeon]
MSDGILEDWTEGEFDDETLPKEWDLERIARIERTLDEHQAWDEDRPACLSKADFYYHLDYCNSVYYDGLADAYANPDPEDFM